MLDIKQSITLYNMMADRLEKSGKAPSQASVYREMVDFISECSTVEEAAKKIKNSKYFLAPSAALVKDKLTVLRDVAEESQLIDLVKVYDSKLAEIDEDVQNIYEAGYERTAQNIKIKYSETLEAFCHLYEVYVILSCDSAGDNEEKQSYINEIHDSLSKLSTPTSDFIQLTKNPKFRELIPATDQGYGKFVAAISDLSAFDFFHSKELDDIDREADAAWEEISSAKDMIKENGRNVLGNIKKSRVTVVSPKDENGHYEYINEVVNSNG